MKTTEGMFADRMTKIPESFIREILKVSTQKEVISFAGGLPNARCFPSEKLAEAAEKVFRHDGKSALQYAPTEGYLPLRDYVAQRLSRKEGNNLSAEDIIILNGSQQGLDLTGKLFINKQTPVLLEAPSYLGAIQAFSAYEPSFHSVPLAPEGPDLNQFVNITRKLQPKFFYCIPNFQNPTGYSYSTSRRIELIESQVDSKMLWIEDNPYGEISFSHSDRPDFRAIIPGRTIQLGSFSKIISPGLRLGWAVGPREVIRMMTIAKQASDLHSNNLAQRIVYQFLYDNSLDEYLAETREFYKLQSERMASLMELHFPESVCWQKPEGGMFIWVTLPKELDAKEVLKKCMENNILFVPGENFFTTQGEGKNTMRLNFSNPSPEDMTKGIAVLGKLLREMIMKQAE